MCHILEYGIAHRDTQWGIEVYEVGSDLFSKARSRPRDVDAGHDSAVTQSDLMRSRV